MIEIDIEQGSDEWLEARKGVISASNFSKFVTVKGDKASTFLASCRELAGERLTGERKEIPQNYAMKRGSELEPEARDYYEDLTGNTVRETGLIYLDERKVISCSPDGLMKDKGLEIKCPLFHTHAGYVEGNKVPAGHYQQVQGCMYVTGLSQWDYLSYFPHFNVKKLFISVDRNDEFIEKMADVLEQANDKIESIVNKLRA